MTVVSNLPTVGSDVDAWGTELNDYLEAPSIGSGDAVSIYNATTAQWLQVTDGTSSTPDATAGPLLKVQRTLGISSSSFTGDGVEACAAIVGATSGVVSNDGQAVGVAGVAKSVSTSVASTGGDDACGVYGAARVSDSGTGVALGGFFNGRRDSLGGNITGIEVSCDNNTASAGSYNSAGFSTCNGIWLHATGTSASGVGLSLGNPFGTQFKVGIGFPAQVAGGLTGGVSDVTISDDGNATQSIAIGGTHTKAITVGSTAGYVVIGGTARLSSSALFEVIGPQSTADPLVQFGQATSAKSHSIKLTSSTGNGSWFISGGVSNFLTGTASGDTGYAIGASGTKYLIGASAGSPALAIKNNSGASELGFFGTTTAAKQTVTGSRGANAALASLLTALAAYGILTDSSS